MAVIRGWTLSGAVVLALATGIPVGCGSDACALSCDAPHAAVRTPGITDPITMKMCVDGDCEELEDERTAAAVTTCLGDDCRELERAGAELFWGFDEALSPDRVRVRVEVRNSSGDVLETFDKGRHPRNSCCGRYITVQYDGDELGWLDY